MAAYKKIQGTSIKPIGHKPPSVTSGVVGHITRNVHIRSPHKQINPSIGKEGFFMGKQASGHVSIKGGQRG